MYMYTYPKQTMDSVLNPIVCISFSRDYSVFLKQTHRLPINCQNTRGIPTYSVST